MSAYFNMSRAVKTSTYVPRLGEVILHEMDEYSGEKQWYELPELPRVSGVLS